MDSVYINQIADQIKLIMREARFAASRDLNNLLIKTYWDIGRVIVENEQDGNVRARYGTRLLTELSKELMIDLGKGFSRSNLQNMRNFFLAYTNLPDVSGKLTWSHYCELINISDSNARGFYENECVNSKWTVRELKRQINTSLFERLLLTDGKTNKETVLALSRKGISMTEPQDILKDPYVFEFLGVREEKPILEKDLERKLIRHIEDFLLELGRGFMFVGSQQRVTLGNTHYYVDMAFYNKILKAYVLIDLKMDGFKAEYAGQMNMYLNFYKTEINEETDNPPVGIILCKSNDDIVAEYALGGLSNQIFASTYVYVIPDKEQLVNEIKMLINEMKDDT